MKGWSRGSRWLLIVALALPACGLTITKDRPSYQELDAQEKQAVDIIIGELTALNAQLKARTRYNIDQIVNREAIDVSFEEIIFAAAYGDNLVHVSTWENLTPEQHSLIQTWFKAATPQAAEQSYKKLFYQFMAVSQGMKQFLFNALETRWVFEHRSLFNVERDSVRNALAHYATVGRKAEMWGFLSTVCTPVIDQFGSRYSSNFTKEYLQSHFSQLADPDDPTGYLYFFCRWVAMGKDDAEDLTTELQWLLKLRPGR